MGALTSTLEDLNGKMHKGGAALGTAAECQACCSRNLGLYLAVRLPPTQHHPHTHLSSKALFVANAKPSPAFAHAL